jgi:hypothetical protein
MVSECIGCRRRLSNECKYQFKEIRKEVLAQISYLGEAKPSEKKGQWEVCWKIDKDRILDNLWSAENLRLLKADNRLSSAPNKTLM